MVADKNINLNKHSQSADKIIKSIILFFHNLKIGNNISVLSNVVINIIQIRDLYKVYCKIHGNC